LRRLVDQIGELRLHPTEESSSLRRSRLPAADRVGEATAAEPDLPDVGIVGVAK
jgi:hypothetical protein